MKHNAPTWLLSEQAHADRRDHLMEEIALAHREECLADATGRRSRRRTWAAAVTVGAFAVGTFAVSATRGGSSGHGPEAFAVERLATGPVRIEIVDTEVAAKQMTQQLKDQGLAITIDTVPTSPQLVGTWLTVSAGNASTADVDQLARQMNTANSSIEVPASLVSSDLELTFGRAPRSGEQIAASAATNALAPRGALYCNRLSGTSPQYAAAVLQQAGYTVHFNLQDDPLVPGQSYQDHYRAFGSQPPVGEVVGAHLNDPFLPFAGSKDVYVMVLPANDPRTPTNLWRGYPDSARTNRTADYSSCP
jgi:hypothetical protein